MLSRSLRTFKVMTAVSKDYSASGLGDGAFAAQLSQELGVKIHRASVTQARKELGIESNVETGPTAAEVREAYSLLARARSVLSGTALGDEIDQFLEGDSDESATESF